MTEFLPVSSSGHLVVARKLLGLEAPELFLEVCLHAGTLVAIVAVFYRDLFRLLKDGVKGLALFCRGAGRAAVAQQAPLFGTAVSIVVGTIPAAVVGLALHDAIKGLFGDPRWCGALIAVTGLLLIASRSAPAGQRRQVSLLRGLVIGIAQALALLPGISRSGSTIVTGYFVGLERSEAARFSFLLSVPALAGAMAWELAKRFSASHATGGEKLALSGDAVIGIALGTLIAAVVGWVCLKVLFRIIRKGKLHWFGAYCVPAGLLFFALSSL